MEFTAPTIDYTDLTPLMVLAGGTALVMFLSLFSDRTERWLAPGTALAFLAGAAGVLIWKLGRGTELVAGTLALDDLATTLSLVCVGGAGMCVLLSLREHAAQTSGRADYYSLLLCSTLGMVGLLQANDLIIVFVSIELLSIPLYVMCASALGRPRSLEAGLKYLIIGSLGSAVLLYGMAFLYGASGSMELTEIGRAITEAGLVGDPLLLIGIALAGVGLAFKLSLAPFHQWTPDVYEGAPTPVTAFMSVATKAAAFGVLVRVLEVGVEPVTAEWQDALAAIAVVSIAVGNIGALGQTSVKRIMAWSSVAQAGYMAVGVVVATEIGVNALVFYLAAYALMTMAAFAVIVARERETNLGDGIMALEGIGRTRPLLAWPITIAMIGLAGLPGTAGFIGKLLLIRAAVDGDFTWLGVAIVLGTMVSLVYYLRIVAVVWARESEAPVARTPGEPVPAIAGGAPAEDESPPDRAGPGLGRSLGLGGLQLEVAAVALVCAAATIVFGVAPDPLTDFAARAGEGLIGGGTPR